MLLPKRVTTLLVNNTPPLINFARKLIPKRVEKSFVLYLINMLAKDFLESGELDFMDGKVVKLSIPDINVEWFFTKDEVNTESQKTNSQSKMKMIAKDYGHNIIADVTFSGNMDAMILMASQKVDPDTLFFKRDLQISGDTELGLEIKNMIDQFDLNILDDRFKTILLNWSDNILEVKHV